MERAPRIRADRIRRRGAAFLWIYFAGMLLVSGLVLIPVALGALLAAPLGIYGLSCAALLSYSAQKLDASHPNALRVIVGTLLFCSPGMLTATALSTAILSIAASTHPSALFAACILAAPCAALALGHLYFMLRFAFARDLQTLLWLRACPPPRHEPPLLSAQA